MVKKVLKFFGYSLFFILALIFFSAKTGVYYFAETQLKQFDIVISNEKFKENFFTLDVKNLDVTAKKIEIAKINQADFTLLFLYNAIHFEDIKLSSLSQNYLPSKIKTVDISYTILHPLTLSLKAKGDFGELNVSLLVLNKHLEATLKPSKLMLHTYQNSLRQLKKLKNGEYTYAKDL